MGNELKMTDTFQERMFERIKDSIGELLSDADLKKLVDAALNKAFFEPRVSKDHWGGPTIKEPLIIEKVRDLMNPLVGQVLSKWREEHSEEIKKAIDETIAKGVYGLIVQHLESRTASSLWELGEKLKAKGIF